MQTAKIILAGFAAATILATAASAQQTGTGQSATSQAMSGQAMTGTVTRIDRLDGTVVIQLQKPKGDALAKSETKSESSTVGANVSTPPEELKTKVQGNLLNTLHAGDRVKFQLTDAGGGSKTISNVERQ